jgi:hypothetical protein
MTIPTIMTSQPRYWTGMPAHISPFITETSAAVRPQSTMLGASWFLYLLSCAVKLQAPWMHDDRLDCSGTFVQIQVRFVRLHVDFDRFDTRHPNYYVWDFKTLVSGNARSWVGTLTAHCGTSDSNSGVLICIASPAAANIDLATHAERRMSRIRMALATITLRFNCFNI